MSGQFDAVVVGGGIVGAVTACLLTKSGLKICLLDKAAHPQWDAHSPPVRVSTLNPASINILRWLGVWDDIKSRRVQPFYDMHVWEHASTAHIRFSARDSGLPSLGVIVENDLAVHYLLQRLEQNYNAKLYFNCALQAIYPHTEYLELTTGKGTINTRLLIGADGVNSAVCRLSNISARRLDYRQDGIISRIRTTLDHSQTAWQNFHPTGPLGILPLSDGSCSIVWSCERAMADQVMSLPDDEFCHRLSALTRLHLGEVTHADRRHRFALGQHHCRTYIAPRTVLVGDAAHSTHPLAGLGANIGLLDAAALDEVLQAAVSDGREIAGRSLLRRYERWRRGENALALEIMRGFKETFGTDHPVLVGARRTGFNLADRFDIVKRIFIRYACGIAGDSPRICRRDFSM